MSNPSVTKLGKFIVSGPTSDEVAVTKLGKFIIVDTTRSDAATPRRKRAPRVYIRYGVTT